MDSYLRVIRATTHIDIATNATISFVSRYFMGISENSLTGGLKDADSPPTIWRATAAV